MTRFELYVNKWKDCRRCDLHRGRKQVVLVRGTALPCDVAFVGEAPGESEDVVGKPFVGPAGKLMDHIIGRSLGDLTYTLMNLVGCIPRGDDGDKAVEPPDEAVEACAPHLIELIELARPRLVVRVGKMAQRWLDPTLKHSVKLPGVTRYVDVVHPAAILRSNVAHQGLQVQRCVVTVQNAVEDMLCGGSRTG